MGRPPKNNAVEEAESTKVHEAPVDNRGRIPNASKENVCPYCNGGYEKNEYDEVVKSDKARPNKVVRVRNGWQCLTCAKDWHESALNQTWSLELERGGEHYAAEVRRKVLRETHSV